MGDVSTAVDAYIASLTLPPHGDVLAETARALAEEIDHPPKTDKGGAISVVGAAKELRATIDAIAALPTAEADPVADIERKRADRAAAAAASADAAAAAAQARKRRKPRNGA